MKSGYLALVLLSLYEFLLFLSLLPSVEKLIDPRGSDGKP
jgi:hypothetical protein